MRRVFAGLCGLGWRTRTRPKQHRVRVRQRTEICKRHVRGRDPVPSGNRCHHREFCDVDDRRGDRRVLSHEEEARAASERDREARNGEGTEGPEQSEARAGNSQNAPTSHVPCPAANLPRDTERRPLQES